MPDAPEPTPSPTADPAAGAARSLVRGLPKHAGERVLLHGWVDRVREAKHLRFLDLRDRTGWVQVVHRTGESAALDEALAGATPESAVRVVGAVQATRDGDGVEVVLESLEVLSVSEPPPALAADLTPEERSRFRFLELRTPEAGLLFEVQTTFETAAREFLVGRDFVELHTPKICAGGSESGAEVFTLDYFGDTACLIQSPQFYMQTAMAAGFDRVFEIGPAFRAERSNSPRHATEFTILHVEMSWITSHHDLMTLEEELLRWALEAVRHVHGEDIERVFGVPVDVPGPGIPRAPLQFANDLARRQGGVEGAEEGDDLRRLPHLAERLLTRWAQEEHRQSWVFVTDYPSAERPFYVMREPGGFDDPTTAPTRSFDLVWRGLEITTGSQREVDHATLLAQAEAAGLDDDVLAGYLGPYYIDMFRYGCPPHGGFGIGINRILLALLARPSLRDTSFVFRGPDRFVP